MSSSIIEEGPKIKMVEVELGVIIIFIMRAFVCIRSFPS